MINIAKFKIGDIVEHIEIGYRGIVFEIDPVFSLTEEWYSQSTLPNSHKDSPWYHVLVDNTQHGTYVPESHLNASVNIDEINHPALEHFFTSSIEGLYQSRQVLM